MSQSNKIKKLLTSAQEDGTISPAASQALNIVDIGAEIEAAMGVDVDDVQSSEVVLVTIMPDDSGSIQYANCEQAVRDGHNLIIEALKATKQADSILAHNRYLNGQILYPYQPVESAVEMDSQNYNANQGTPLYDQAVVLLGTVLAKSQEFAENGVPVRTVTLIISDGEDQHSCRSTAYDCAKIIKDMLKAENHIVAAMGIGDDSAYFKQIFKEMGIQDKWILTPGNTKSEIREAFQMFSQSSVQAVKSAGSFSQTSMGGFGN